MVKIMTVSLNGRSSGFGQFSLQSSFAASSLQCDVAIETVKQTNTKYKQFFNHIFVLIETKNL